MADIWDYVAPGAAILGGTFLTANANRDAAARAGAAAIQGAQIHADAIARAQQQERELFDIAQQRADAAKVEAQKIYGEQRALSAPGVSYLRNVVANPGDLTPQQQQQLADSRLNINNTIHNSSFAGSGRSAAALFKRGEADTVNEMLTANRARSDNAAGVLAGQNAGAVAGSANAATTAGGQGANIATTLGTNVGKLEADAGKVQGDAYGKAGLYDAQAGLATGTAMGKAIGDIGSQIATSQRESRYGDRLSKLEASLSKNYSG